MPAPVAVVATLTINGGCEQYRPLLSKYDWNVDVALAIMEAESTHNGIKCNSQADNTGLNRNGTTDKGLMQINDIHVDSGLISDSDRLDPEKNIAAAYAIYSSKDNFTAWSSYNSGAYLKYLKK